MPHLRVRRKTLILQLIGIQRLVKHAKNRLFSPEDGVGDKYGNHGGTIRDKKLTFCYNLVTQFTS